MLKLNSLIHLIGSFLVMGIFVGGLVYYETDVRIPYLGWPVSLFYICALAATAIVAIAWALGMDLGEFRTSVTVDDIDWDDWD